MKKLTFCILTASVMLLAIPNPIKAATNNEISRKTDKLNKIKSIDSPALIYSENKEALTVAVPTKNEQGRHNGRYQNQRRNRNVDLTIQPNRGYGHHHNGVYFGGGGLLILVLILILVL